MVKFLFYDLEVGELVGTTYDVYDTTIRTILQPKYILCFSYAWVDPTRLNDPKYEPKVKGVKLSDFPARFKNNPFDDYDVVKALNELVKQANWRCAYNGKKFDDKVSNARFAYYGMDTIDFKSCPMIDPLLTMKREMKLEKNSLDYACKFFGIEGKTKVTYADVDKECSQVENWWKHKPVEINKKAWKLMDDYCKNDTAILVKLYTRTRSMDRTHPNVSIYLDGQGCPVCGGQRLKSNGIRPTNSMIYRRLNCLDCGAPIKERLADKDEQNKPEYVR